MPHIVVWVVGWMDGWDFGGGGKSGCDVMVKSESESESFGRD
jgi:hypothetical protein